MKFNKIQSYQDNQSVIKEIFDAYKEKRQPDPKILKKYKGYGGLKEVLLPIDNKNSWVKSNLKYYEEVSNLYKLIYTNLPKHRADNMISSIKSNVLSSFYTDMRLVEPIFKVLNKNFFNSSDDVLILDPSCGKGVFFDAAKKYIAPDRIKGVGFDLDRLVAFIAKKLNSETKIVCDGFETSDSHGFVQDNQFDIVTSNIPFGDFRIFDESFAKGNNVAKKDSQKKIHNYFFTKGLDKANSGGLLAYYTSTGVMDSPSNQFVREHLMKNAQLVTALRLPNNTFQESAGTEVTSDLILLRKREVPLQSLDDLNESEKGFIESTKIHLKNKKGENTGFNLNNYFQDKPENIIGELKAGQFQGGRDVLTVEPTETCNSIEKIAKSLEDRLENTVQIFKQSNQVKQKEKIEEFQKQTDQFDDTLFQNKIQIADISEKDFVVKGETYIIREFLRDNLKGIWKRKHNGWMFPKSRQKDVELSLYNHLKTNTKKVLQTEDRPDDFQYTLNFGFVAEDEDESKLRTKSKSTTKPKQVEPKVSKITKETAEEHYLVTGNLFYYEGYVGILDKDTDGDFLLNPLKLSEKEIETAKTLIDIRIAYKRLYDLEVKGMQDRAEQQRELLNFKYNKFVEKHGFIVNIKHGKIIENEIERYKLYALEREEKGKIVKADIFFKSTFDQEVAVVIENLPDAILSSLSEHGELNIKYISETLNREQEDIIKEGIEDNLIFPEPVIPKGFNGFKDSPDESEIEYKWTTRDVFLSGDIRNKILFAEKYKTDQFINESQIDLYNTQLKKVCPAFLDVNLINPQLGERWIDKNIFKKFGENLFKCDVSLDYKNSLDEYTLKVKEFSGENRKTYCVKSKNGRTYEGQVLFNHAMNDTSPNMTYKIGEIKYVDHESIRKAELIINEIKKKFSAFIGTREYYIEHLERKYNYLLNQNVKREFNGSHLKFPRLKHFEPYTHQKDGAWMIMQNNGAIIDHKVGSGKTLLMAISAMEMKRLGICKKPILIAKKANADAVRDDFALAYPDAKILMPKVSETTPAKRQAFFEKIMINDWDAVVMTHDQFKTIPQSREMIISIIKSELDNLQDDLDAQKGKGEYSKGELSGLEKRKKNLTAKLEENFASIKKNPNIISFDKMGLDHLMVDESHVYKNLSYTTRHRWVAGLSNPEGSQHALNLLTAVRTLQQHHGGDKGVTFLSGTTISNSLVEMYSLFKYLRPEKMKQLKIKSFDGWAKVFAEKSSDYEINQNSEIKKRERFRTFVKIPELANLYNEIANVITDANFKVDKPEIDQILVSVDQTQAQKEYTKRLIEFCKTGNKHIINRPDLNDRKLQAKMLIATNLAKKASLDMRLIDPSYEFEDAGKITALCERVAKHYHQFEEDKGTQLIFSDVGVPSSKDLNIYQEVKNRLVQDYGVKIDDIEFIHDHDSKLKKRKLNKAVNAGEKRIVIGSTEKLGTGTNMQERIVALHHLDIPWRPSDMEQRNGRGGRQGNWLAREKNNNKVDTYVYATNRSLDAYKFSLLAIKQTFIDKIKDSSISNRKISEADSEGAVNFAEFMAATSGNQDLLEKAKLQKQLANLEAESDIYKVQRVKDVQEREYLTTRIKKSTINIEKLKKDGKILLPLFSEDKNSLNIGGKTLSKAKDIGEALLKRITQIDKFKNPNINDFTHALEVGEIPGKLKVKYKPSSRSISVTSSLTGMVFNYNEGRLNENPVIAGQFIKRAINRIPYICENTQRRLSEMEVDLKGIKSKLTTDIKDYTPDIDIIKEKIIKLGMAIELANKKSVPDEKKEQQNKNTQAIKI